MNKRKNNNSDINVPNTIKPFKVKFVLVFTLIIILSLIARIFYLQIIDGPRLQASATSQQTLTETLSAKRGNIYSSDGQALAMSYESDKVYVDPTEIAIENREIVAKGLADNLGIDYAQLLDKINTSTSRILVEADVEQDKITKIEEWKSNLKFKTGITIEDSTSRYYPHGTLASTVLGFTGSDNQGLYGIEFSWDSFLSGTAGKSVSLKDASQSEIANSENTYIAAENGYDLTLTIDSNIQGIVEKHLAEAVDTYLCDSGIAIAMNPTNGKILAMADYPSYDSNNPNTPNSKLAETWDTLSTEDKSNALFRMWTPKAINDTYEPGSVFKLITASIALEENLIETDVEKSFNCTGYYYIQGEDKPIRCWKYYDPHGEQTLRQALEHSCNPAFMELGLRIGKETSYKYYDAFGLFDKTGISLSGEANSIFYDINKMGDHELACMSFGERFTITPIQMITAASAIANDGILVKPQIVEKMTNTDTGEVTEFKTEEVRQVISKETADKVTSMMESVVTEGSGQRAIVQGYSIGGKTGTSEPRENVDEGYTASFLAISPVENTQIVLLVILKNPGPGVNHNGGVIAAPTASKMLAEILPYMGVESGNNNTTTNANNLSEEDLY